MTPEKHAVLSASGAHRWLNCTPSPRLEEQFPESDSEYAKEGTLAHKIAELKVNKCFTKMKPSAYKKAMSTFESDPLYQREMDNYTTSYLEFIKDVYAAYPSKPVISTEQRLDFSHIVPEGFGTGDCIIIGGGKLTVIDFKYGKGVPVSAEDNPQMMLYAIGALNAVSMLYNIKNIELIIFQPRLDNISRWELTSDKLNLWAESIIPIAQSAYNGEGEFKVGDWCRFCRAKGLCRARAVFSQETYDKKHGFLPPLISNNEVGEILKRADVIKKWIADIEEWALHEILSGGQIIGWKAVEGVSRRKFNDTDKALEAAKKAGYDEAVLYERIPITLAAMEKLMGKQKFGELMTEYVVKPEGKPTLAPENDKRPAFSGKITASEAFSEERTN